MSFEIGETAVLKSGGPVMTIAAVGVAQRDVNGNVQMVNPAEGTDPTHASCVWFDESDNARSSLFHVKTLKKKGKLQSQQ